MAQSIRTRGRIRKTRSTKRIVTLIFLHAEALRNVIMQSSRVWATTMHRYVTFINFHDGACNMILELKNDPTKQAYQEVFMINDDDVDTIVKEWLDEWCRTLAETLPEGEYQEDPTANEGGNICIGSDAGNG